MFLPFVLVQKQVRVFAAILPLNCAQSPIYYWTSALDI
jgi:hypothetical protein